MGERLSGWAASCLGAVALIGLLRLVSPWLGFAIRPGLPSFLVAAVLGVPGVILLLALHLVLFVL